MTSLSQKTYAERASVHPNLVARRFFETAGAKQSNLIVSADFTSTEALLHCADSKYPTQLSLCPGPKSDLDRSIGPFHGSVEDSCRPDP